MNCPQLVASSTVSGVLVGLFCTPFDVVKNYSQYSWGDRTSSSSSSSGFRRHAAFREAVKQIYQLKGAKAFWTGLIPGLCVIVPANIIFFALYEKLLLLKEKNKEKNKVEKKILPILDQQVENKTTTTTTTCSFSSSSSSSSFSSLYYSSLLSSSAALPGIQARSVAVTVVAPVEFLRTKLQVEVGERVVPSAAAAAAAARGGGGWHLLKTTISNDGWLSLWRGIIPTLLRDVPFSAIYWELNHRFKLVLHRLDHSHSDHRRSRFFSNFAYPFITGGTSAALACVVTHPCDIIKTHLQARPFSTSSSNAFPFLRRPRPSTSAFKIVKGLWREGGFRAFSVGLAARLAKIVPSCAVLLSTYEFSTYWAVTLNDQRN